jgi:hypothetical protein
MQRSMQLTKIAAQSMGTEKHAIICGFGRNGQYLARFLAQESINYMALDLDPGPGPRGGGGGRNVVYGDAGRKETLIAAGLMRASRADHLVQPIPRRPSGSCARPRAAAGSADRRAHRRRARHRASVATPGCGRSGAGDAGGAA